MRTRLLATLLSAVLTLSSLSQYVFADDPIPAPEAVSVISESDEERSEGVEEIKSETDEISAAETKTEEKEGADESVSESKGEENSEEYKITSDLIEASSKVTIDNLAAVSTNALNVYIINGVSVSYDLCKDSAHMKNCWEYANCIYQKIWGTRFTNNRTTSDNILRELSMNECVLTADNMRSFISKAPLGSVIRLSGSDTFSVASDSSGHSQILVQKDDNGFTVIEANITINGVKTSREKYSTWSSYVQTWYNNGSTHKYVKYIKCPKSDPIEKFVLDLNGQLDGEYASGLKEYGTCDIYLNGELVADDVDNYWEELPAGTMWEIKDIKAKPGYEYKGVAAGALVGKLAHHISIELQFDSRPKCVLDLNGWLDGEYASGLKEYGTCDIYLNGELVADDVDDYWEELPAGTMWEIKDIKAKPGYEYKGVAAGALVGELAHHISIELQFDSRPKCVLDLNGRLDGEYASGLKEYGTCDIYLNGELVADDVDNYWEELRAGTRWEIKDIKAKPGYEYKGVAAGALVGEIAHHISIELQFDSRPKYALDLNGLLDGEYASSLKEYGTCDIYLNGELVADDVDDYWEELRAGTRWEINDIKAKPGYEYKGVAAGALVGEIAHHISIELQFDSCLLELTIIKQPVSVTAASEEQVSFCIEASGSDLIYQWQVSSDNGTTWTNCTESGNSTDRLSFTMKSAYRGYQYRCLVSDKSGQQIVSDVVTVTQGYDCHGYIGDCVSSAFVDMPNYNNYQHKSIDWAVFNKITQGSDATHFRPELDCTRAQVVTFLWRANGMPEPKSGKTSFGDVKSSAYYYKAVLWAVEEGITTGKDATHFLPDDKVSRSQFVTFLWRAAGKTEPESTKNVFVDVPSSAYYYKAVLWAAEKGITTGKDATHFLPDGTCTRGQVVTFLYRNAADK